MRKNKDSNWTLPDPVQNWTQVGVAVLMDIRDELKTLNALLHCENFHRIPRKLDRISRNTYEGKRRRTAEERK
jgi:hypothetical protein